MLTQRFTLWHVDMAQTILRMSARTGKSCIRRTNHLPQLSVLAERFRVTSLA